MSEPLAKVTSALDVPRHSDAEISIQVPGSWRGEDVVIELPRRATCALCHGGGCDGCARSGAVALVREGEELEPLRLALPVQEADCLLRLPHQGGLDAEHGQLPRGHLHLLLRWSEDESASPSVTRVATASQETLDAQRSSLMKWSLLMAAGLIATFLGLLRLSGWL